MGWTFYNASGEALTSFGPVALTDLDIDGGTDIGEAIVDADLFIVDNGAGGTNVKATAADIETYIGAAKIATGTYTGDGSTSQAITGVGFTVKWVWITERKTADGDLFAIKQLVFTSDRIITDTSGNDASITIITGSGDVRIADGAIIALGSDGFTVDDAGGDADPNQNGVVYNYMALG